MAFTTDYLKNVRIARPEDVSDALNLRYRHICRWNRYLPDRGTPELSIGDKFDPYTDYLVYRDEANAVKGMVRMIRPNPLGFFMQQYVDPRAYFATAGDVWELSELVIHKDEHDTFKVLGALTAAVTRYLVRNEAERIASISIKPIHKYMRRIGFINTGVTFPTGWNQPMTLHVCPGSDRLLQHVLAVFSEDSRDDLLCFVFPHGDRQVVYG
ncbi:hypothetical protein CAI21_06760 [Alkalilimnicola ehrlichii]|uniref:Acyl-homoserine-lactone synthase n=1 Tax=Alkalilimnicola ehrlichii TaxID=351052 RepID=A0A3E0X0E4_9GAMM|nr:GNAT family N-acyltransferase [Alkalilimnicola ehrlichii]RFA30306.1 hypothetical protein CAI21_06760 [Alkalilimnicola ehrlichii]RFA37883.1 hypothetical protein CAL65_08110 [Alkalilimnicola ehrlichii]